MKIKTLGYIALVGAIVLTASTPIAYTIGNNISPVVLSLLISLVGTVASFTIMIAKGKQKHLKEAVSSRTHFLSLFAVALFMFVGVTLVFSYVTHYVDAGLLAVVHRTWPLMLIALAPVVFREKLSKWDVAGVLIGFAALASTLISGTAISLPTYVLPFIGIILIAALGDALATAIQKRYTYELYSSIFIYNFMALVIFSIIALATAQTSLAGFTIQDVYVVLFLGLIQNIMLTFAYMFSVRTVKTAIFSNSFLIIPFITMALGVAILKQAIELPYIVVGLGVIAGLVVQKLAPRTSTYITKNKDRDSKAYRPTLYDVTSAFINTKNADIYNAMKGSGRVLAFYTGNGTNGHESIIKQENGTEDGCMVFTNKNHGGSVSQGELEFIKDMMGHNEDDLVVFGVGDPKVLEEKLSRIGSNIEGV